MVLVQNGKSTSKAIDALILVTEDCRRLSEISKKLGINKSTVHRLLKTLKEKGLVYQNKDTQEYFPGPVLFRLINNPVKAHQLLIRLAYSSIDNLRNVTGETISLTIRLGMEKVNILQLNAANGLIFFGDPKYSQFIWTGATGKAILSQLPEEELDAILDSIILTPFTPKTITDKKVFKSEIAKVRQRGYSTGFGETDPFIGSICVPIKHYYTPACISIVGPADRLSPHIPDYSEELIKVCQIISQNVFEALQTFNKPAI